MLTFTPIPDRLRFTGGAASSDVTITNNKGEIVYTQQGVIHPDTWSHTAVTIVAAKYFKVIDGVHESSVFNLAARVVDAITAHGVSAGYFDADNSEIFRDALTHLILSQSMAFNSPVWFNVGIHDKPQASACFINSIHDTMESILDFVKTEGMLFKSGSGSGVNLSRLRGSGAPLSGGGTASGAVSFMRGLDGMAGVIKSGGGNRRSAAMRILEDDHPDILAFIRCKADAEKVAHALIDAGYDGAFNAPGGAYDIAPYQNANHSVAVSAATMARVDSGEPEAVALLDEIAAAAWFCGDPGVWFVDTVNSWNTVPNHGPIRAPNPCGEFNFVDDTACNLASLNLMRFRCDDGTFDTDAFTYAARVTITAQEILCDLAGYPTPAITKNSHDLRPLGLGYANLGALLMSLGLPYDSDEARHLAGAITSLMSATAYHQSAILAQSRGPFAGFEANRAPMLRVIEKHAAEARSLYSLVDDGCEAEHIADLSMHVWDKAIDLGDTHGYRNSQVTVLAPTGTIGFMMDCDTTGIEPDFALVKNKKLVGGGVMRIVNQSVPRALRSLNYSPDAAARILSHLEATGDINTAPDLNPTHRAVFACANDISPSGHLRMMAAAQPFLSGAISKTVNLPASATPADIAAAYREAYRLGLKAVAIYRDGCKRSQPLNTKADPTPTTTTAPPTPTRQRLPATCEGIRHKFSIAGHDGYLHVGLYEDGRPGEVFVQMSKEGSTLSGIVDQWATALSIALQYGVPLAVLTGKMSGARFEPSGFTGNPEIPIALSITDYIGRWLDLRFNAAQPAQMIAAAPPPTLAPIDASGPPCTNCGTLTQRAGACYVCPTCATTTGCG